VALPLTVTFLGTGTSQGVPMIGCHCAVCSSADPRDRRTRSSIHVATPECAWVVDTGPDFRAQCLRERIERIEAVVYTHSHTDHVMGFDDLRPFCNDGRRLPVHASAETMADLKRIFQFAFTRLSDVPGYVKPLPHLIDGPFTLGSTVLTPLPLQHGAAHVNGYLFEEGGRKLAAYLSDCKVVPDAVIERIRGVGTLIIDALRHRDHPTHLTIGEALAVAARVEPGATWFTHICHDLGHAETEAALPAGTRIAYDGLKLEIQ
jgi:phosphoribosyl 1,2-cyclic phosphate phosphodiesterase